MKGMQEGKRFISPVGAASLYQHSLPLATERGQMRPTTSASAVPSYSQQHLLSRARAASSGARRVSTTGGASLSGNVLNGNFGALQRTASSGRRQGSSVSKTRKSVSAAVASPDVRHVTFTNQEGQSSKNFSCLAPSSGALGDQYSNNNSNIIINSEDSNPVQHLLSELVGISQALATYLQNGSSGLVLQHRRGESQNDNRGALQQQQHATLKAQEIERIVKRVEKHFAQKIAYMERKEKEQAERIVQLTKELYMLQQKGQPVCDSNPSWSNMQHPQTPALNGPSGSPRTACLHQQPEPTVKENSDYAATNNSFTDIGSEVDKLRRMLQEEKRQRLFVEEQTQSLTEQHSRIVSTLERRLQKQEEQLRELAASLERQPAASSTSQSPRTPRRHQQQPGAQGERALEAELRGAPGGAQLQTTTPLPSRRANIGTRKDFNGDDVDGLFLERDRTKPKSQLANESDSRYLSGKAPHIFLPESSLSPTFQTSHQQLGIKENQKNSREQVASLVDIGAAKAVEEVDEITVFLDNITQELESIDAMEGERERQISATVGKRML